MYGEKKPLRLNKLTVTYPGLRKTNRVCRK